MKIDFNVPLLKASGEPETQPRFDFTRMKPGAQGQLIPALVLDEEGHAVLDPISIGGVLRTLLNTAGQNETELPFEERSKRAKLARKVGDTSGGSLKNYSDEEIEVIRDRVAKNGSTELVGQVDDLLSPANKEESAAA